MFVPWKKSYDQPRQHIKKQRHYFANKGLSSQSYGFSSSHVWMWKLDSKESWALKNWCFWTVEEDYWESLGLQGHQTSQPSRKSVLNIHWKHWCWSWNSNTLAIWFEELTHWKNLDARKDWRQEEKGMTEDEMAGWNHPLDGHEFGWTPGVGDGQVGLACWDSWDHKESDTTEWLNWTELHWNLTQIIL